MKMKYHFDKSYDYDDKVFVGFHKGKPYAISEEKKLVKRYMEKHRMLTNDEYEIYKFTAGDSLVCMRGDLVLYDYNGVFITERDIVMCEIFTSDIDHRVKDLYQSLFSFTRLLGQIDDTEKDVKNLVHALKSIQKISDNKKIMNRLSEIDDLENPIIYCNIDEYWIYVQRYEEYLNTKDRWFMD